MSDACTRPQGPYYCTRDDAHDGPCATRPIYNRRNVAARAIAKARFMDAIAWDSLSKREQDQFHEEAAATIAALDAHEDDHVWTEVVRAKQGGAMAFVTCRWCDAIGWRE